MSNNLSTQKEPSDVEIPDFDALDMLLGFLIAAITAAQIYWATALLLAAFIAQKTARRNAALLEALHNRTGKLLPPTRRALAHIVPQLSPSGAADAGPNGDVQAEAAPEESSTASDPSHEPALLPALDGAQRLLIVGASDAGKTTLLRHLLDRRHNALVIDPHATPGKWGQARVVGAGRDYAAIADTLTGLVTLMHRRYKELEQGSIREGEHGRCTVVIDEWRAITRNIPNAGELIACLLTEARKVNIDLIVATHSERVKALGLEGEGDLRDGFTVVRLKKVGDTRTATLDHGEGARRYVMPGTYRPATPPTQPATSPADPTGNALLAQLLTSAAQPSSTHAPDAAPTCMQAEPPHAADAATADTAATNAAAHTEAVSLETASTNAAPTEALATTTDATMAESEPSFSTISTNATATNGRSAHQEAINLSQAPNPTFGNSAFPFSLNLIPFGANSLLANLSAAPRAAIHHEESATGVSATVTERQASDERGPSERKPSAALLAMVGALSRLDNDSAITWMMQRLRVLNPTDDELCRLIAALTLFNDRNLTKQEALEAAFQKKKGGGSGWKRASELFDAVKLR